MRQVRLHARRIPVDVHPRHPSARGRRRRARLGARHAGRRLQLRHLAPSPSRRPPHRRGDHLARDGVHGPRDALRLPDRRHRTRACGAHAAPPRGGASARAVRRAPGPPGHRAGRCGGRLVGEPAVPGRDDCSRPARQSLAMGRAPGASRRSCRIHAEDRRGDRQRPTRRVRIPPAAAGGDAASASRRSSKPPARQRRRTGRAGSARCRT